MDKLSTSSSTNSKEPLNLQRSVTKKANCKDDDTSRGMEWLFSMAALGGAIIFGLRSAQVPLFGYDLNVFIGGVPIECLIWTIAVIGIMAQEFREVLGFSCM